VQRDEADVAVGVRQSRKDGVVSRTLSAVFWKVFNRVSSLELPRGGVDIFALSRSARETLNSFEESSTSLIGLIYWMGFRRQEVPYHRVERQVGKSSWSLQKRKLREGQHHSLQRVSAQCLFVERSNRSSRVVGLRTDWRISIHVYIGPSIST